MHGEEALRSSVMDMGLHEEYSLHGEARRRRISWASHIISLMPLYMPRQGKGPSPMQPTRHQSASARSESISKAFCSLTMACVAAY